jgi:hypothetical protein
MTTTANEEKPEAQTAKIAIASLAAAEQLAVTKVLEAKAPEVERRGAR